MKLFVNELSDERLETAEALLFNGNGYIGLRNNLTEEKYDFFNSNRETYINGFYEQSTIAYPEPAYGFTKVNETMVSVIDSQTVNIYIGGIKVNLSNYSYLEHKRFLDMEKGISKRSYICVDEVGNKTKITQTRLVSFTKKQIYVDYYEFDKLNHKLKINLVNEINFEPQKAIDITDPRMSHDIIKVKITDIDINNSEVKFETERSKLQATFKFDYNINYDSIDIKENRIDVHFEDVTSRLLKVNGYFKNGENVDIDINYNELLSSQEDYMSKFWRSSKIEIDAEDDIEMSINYGNYALLQSTGDAISAKGLSGSGYEGHYFWDAEMYVLPMFIHTNPKIAKRMLKYRIEMLPKAIQNREMIGYKSGALYPWRTISGNECSAFFEAGMAQHHINADICYGLIKYVENTNDYSILKDGGMEMLYQTSLFYKSICYFRDGKFHIDKVTGPDEYSVLVNDNFYTNIMVKYQFEKLLEYAEKLNYKIENLSEYKDIAQNMYFNINKKLNIVEQDRDFLNKNYWPYKEEKKRPLLMYYHPLEIYRYQISKQADAVLALMLHPNFVSNGVVEDTVNYYDKVTTHDSSLSFSAYSTCYSRLGKTEKAYKYFMKNAKIDIDNIHGNTKDGIHTASMGGTYTSILYGFLGLEFSNGKIIIKPKLPKQIKRIKLQIEYKEEKYELIATHEDSIIKVVERN